MKKIYTTCYSLLMLAFLASPAFAQNLSISMETVAIELDGVVNYDEVMITNNSNETIEMALTLNRDCYQEGDDTKVSICFGEFCFPGTNDLTTTWGTGDDVILYIEPNQSSGAFKFSPSWDADMGSSWDCVFFDRNNPDNKVELHVDMAECSIVGTRDLAESLTPAYPNPATDLINLPLSASLNSTLTIVNATGVTMNTTALDSHAKTAQMDISNFAEGVYFYYVTKENGTRTRAATFLKQ